MEFFLYFLPMWLIFSFVPMFIAEWKGRGPGTWFLLSLLVSPLVATVLNRTS